MLEKLVAERRAAAGPDRRRGALHRRRGRRPLPRRARRAAAGRAAGELPRGRSRTPLRHPGPPLRRAPTAPSRPRSSADRYGVDPTPGAARAGAGRARWSAASCCPAAPSASGATPTSCAGCAAPASPTCARRSRPPTRASFARFLPSWQNVDAHRAAGAGPDRLREALVPLQGVALTPKVWERDVLPRRLGAYSPDLARRALHQRRGRLDRRRRPRPQRRPGRPLLPRGRPARRPAAGQREARAAPRARSTTRSASGSPPGPCFWLDLLAELDVPGRGAPQGALGPRLVGRGDQRRLRAAARAAPARGPLASERGGRRFARRRAAGGGRGPGPLVADRAAVRERARGRPAAARPGRADARALRDRHPRDGRSPRASPAASRPSTASSATSSCSAPPAAATSSRAWAAPSSRSPARSSGCARCPRPTARFQLLAATDPANPYGASLPWPKREGRPPARPGARRLRPAPRRRAGRSTSSAAAGASSASPSSTATSWRRRCGALADAVAGRPPAEARGRETRRRAGDRLRPRGGAARGRLQPRPPQADRRGALRPMGR